MHYKSHLREAFHLALWAYLFEDEAELEPGLFWVGDLDARWLSMGPEERLSWIAGQLWRCTDIMPGDTCDALDMRAGSTYAQACRRIRRGDIAPLVAV